MTREEAIFCEGTYLGENNCINCKYYATDTCELRESHKMAIKALKAEPCEDAVSRQAVIAKAKDEAEGMDEPFKSNFAVLAEWLLDKLPSVTPKPRTGKWISIRNKKETEIAVRCDCCGNSPKHAIRSDYCPHCGAKMEGVNE